MTLRRHALAALGLAAVVAAAVLPRAAVASKADAFEGKIQPVSGQLYQKAGRIEVTAGGAMSLNDAFFKKYMGDLKLGYHFTEHWSASIHAAAGTAVPTGSTTVCPTGQGCRDANDAELFQVPGRIRGIAGAEVAWSPIYGKLNTFSEKVAHVDLSLLAGIDLVLHDEVLSPEAAAALDASGGTPKQLSGTLPNPLPFGANQLPFSVHVGIGARVFVTEGLAVRIDLKDYVYRVEVPNGETRYDTQNQLFIELGVSYFLPSFYRRLP
jgi:outer membrane beta-barrel protein